MTRARFVFPTNEIPHLWAHGSRPAGRIRNAQGNLFAEGSDIYSYGYHFPIARRVEVANPSAGAVEVVYLFTTRGYSNTTGGHIHAARCATRNLGRIIHMDPTGVDGARLWDILTTRKGSARPVAAWYQSRVDSEARAAAKPRIRAATRMRHMAAIESILAEWREVRTLFRLRLGEDAVRAPGSVDEVRAKYAAEFAREERERAARLAEEAEREARQRAADDAAESRALAEVLPAWRAGGPASIGEGAERASIRAIRYPVLRIVGEEVETSFGARVPVEDARKALRILPRLIDRMGENGAAVDDAATLGAYRGISATRPALRIGCHSIPWAEVGAFCAFVGWDCPALPVPA